MARKCTVCEHPEIEEINKCLVNNETLRKITKQFPGITSAALYRHKEHLPQTLVKAQGAIEAVKASSVLTELQRCFDRVNKLFDACDEWLRDADDPSKYNIDPRSDDVIITYSDIGPDGKIIKKKAKLSVLLSELRGAGHFIESWESKCADPRELILKTAGRLSGQIEILAKLILLMDQDKRLTELEKRVNNEK